MLAFIILTFSASHAVSLTFEDFFDIPKRESDYEIVNLPLVLPVRESVTENGETVSEVLLNFDAFGR